MCAAWFSAAMTPNWHSPVLPGARPPLAVESGAELAREIARLHERLRPDTAPRPLARNLFAFRAPRNGHPATAAAASGLVGEIQSVPALVPAFGLALAGLAEDNVPGGGPDGVVRTAIIAGHGQLFLVKAGETVVDGEAIYTVGPIGAEGVELTGQRDGRTQRLTLKP